MITLLKSFIPVELAAAALLAAAMPSVAHAGDYKVYGSQWALDNDYAAPGQIGCSFDSTSTPGMTFWYNFSSSALWGYPACIRGYHYGQNPTGDTTFPMQVSQMSSAPCNFSYSTGSAYQQGDFAYDMFLRWDTSTTGNPQLEVMVWGDNDSWPIGNLTASNAVYTANRWFDLWEGYNSSAGYWVYTFIPSGISGSTTSTIATSGNLNVDMKVFYNWLTNNRTGSYFNNNMYLDVIEAGYEIVRGNTWTWIGADINAYSGVADGTYKIIARHSGKAMEAPNQWTGNGQQINQWSYYGGASQQWTVSSLGNNLHKIIGVQSGKSVDISGWGTGNGTKVQLWDYVAGTNQQFYFNAAGGGYYEISPSHATGSCLDVEGGTGATSDGANVHLWQWVGATNQQWSFQTP
jgi:Ricin-type beta-trefoil lectin domain-like/Glycosyl hydrolase family 12